jgi:hypothetical protein
MLKSCTESVLASCVAENTSGDQSSYFHAENLIGYLHAGELALFFTMTERNSLKINLCLYANCAASSQSAFFSCSLTRCRRSINFNASSICHEKISAL